MAAFRFRMSFRLELPKKTLLILLGIVSNTLILTILILRFLLS